MQNQNFSFFQSVERSFDKAAKFTKWDKGLLTQIKACNSIYSMRFPVKMDDGRIEVIEAYQFYGKGHQTLAGKSGARYLFLCSISIDFKELSIGSGLKNNRIFTVILDISPSKT